MSIHTNKNKAMINFPHDEIPLSYPPPLTVVHTPRVASSPSDSVRIIRVRGCLTILDSDLATLFQSTVDVVNKVVMRKASCFPRGACFRLSSKEWELLQKIIDASTVDRGNWLCTPLVFTRSGTNALSVILDTDEATQGGIMAERTFQTVQQQRTATAATHKTERARA